MSNHTFINALLKKEVSHTPIWIMRQAGRYLPEYKATRAQAGSFMDLCTNPELACEVTLQPLERFKLDAAILFSDILTIPDAMGLGLYFEEGEGPKFERPADNEKAIKNLGVVDPEDDLKYVMDAVRTIRRELNDRVPLIGFSGSPWTLATYMVEGSSSKEFSKIKAMMFNDPKLLHHLLKITAQSVTAYLNAQIAAGAQAVQIFDTWGGILAPHNYKEFSLNYMKEIIAGLNTEVDGETIPVIVFTKNGGQWLEDIAAIGSDAVGLDWTCDINQARARIGDKVALQGNLDPNVLYASEQAIEQEVERVLAGYGDGSGHVFNLGHGVHQHIDPEKVGFLVDAVHRISKQYHK
jgi:uroporphyrinogen decarboxylase